ncbi:unnamed protein product [Rotaria socialis]|uniref:G domain-containing protein n=1 Tax=Rotaria socialis TaxID=392032 RepID=A0A820N1W2_9BILA|nr:unnamed protein product [Rotaria socialis]CAF3424474.1 unnamed protein product [Rotaria socialis]CAF4381905.1 unnamed protein product [Rotaria socialis]CAF4899787.1 unnamed protein product [Rotaria socialis]
MRTLLSQDFALGVIGPGKSGKSTLVRELFGFDTNQDKEKRTEDLHSYRVNDDFRVVDFPHMTAVFDSVRNCFTCNHALVNAVVVVLNAEQGGNDKDGEGYVIAKVKELAKKGVHVLYCFNQCDKLALKHKPVRNQRNIDKFSLYESGKIEQMNAVNDSNSLEYWTEEHVEAKRIQWAKNYQLDLEKCWMTFCDLEETDHHKSMKNYRRLRQIKLRTHSDIKTEWLREVLEQNSVSERSIGEIVHFRYEEE